MVTAGVTETTVSDCNLPQCLGGGQKIERVAPDELYHNALFPGCVLLLFPHILFRGLLCLFLRLRCYPQAYFCFLYIWLFFSISLNLLMDSLAPDPLVLFPLHPQLSLLHTLPSLLHVTSLPMCSKGTPVVPRHPHTRQGTQPVGPPR